MSSNDDNYKSVLQSSSTTGMTETAGSVLQYVYTIVLDDLTETNPSPIYSDSWIQFIERDEETMALNGYIQKMSLTGIDIPSDIASNAKKIKIYRRSSLYTEEALDIGAFLYVREFDVTNTITGISATDSTPVTDKEASYDSSSDLAGDDICNVNNIVFVANAKSKNTFPVSLTKWYEIHISVIEQYPIIDARFPISTVALNSFIDSTAWTSFFLLSDWKQRIRFYHSDAITPLMCMVDKAGDTSDSNSYPVFYIKSPLISSGGEYIVYMGIDIAGTGTALTNVDVNYG